MISAPTDRSKYVRTALPVRHGTLAAIGILLFHLSWAYAGDPLGFWLPGLGVGIALVAWFGWPMLIPLAVDLFLVRSWQGEYALRAAYDVSLSIGQIGFSWYLYRYVAQGSRWLEDPRSAMVFLLLPCALLSGAAGLALALADPFFASVSEFGNRVLEHSLGRTLGVLATAPFCLAVLTGFLIQRRCLSEPRKKPFSLWIWSGAEAVELAGLCLGSGLLALVLVATETRAESPAPSWPLRGVLLLVVVWTALRQSLRGATSASLSATLVCFGWFWPANSGPGLSWRSSQEYQLALSSVALLVGTAIGWVRASEARYRHVVGRIPLMLYSVRLPRGISALPSGVPKGEGYPERKPALRVGPEIAEEAEVVLVGSACQQILNCAPELLIGPFENWMRRIFPDDREVLLATLTQLCLQRTPVTCEYRLMPQTTNQPSSMEINLDLPAAARTPSNSHVRWVRDTLAPHHTGDGKLDGWEGVVEDITEQRLLAQDLRRTTGLLKALVSNLPAGVFFLRGPNGLPIMVNARARQLLGQREDLSASLKYLPEVYRLHRTDGSEYPYEELPVSIALMQGKSASANDIVVWRPDGRKVPLISWAAPVDIAGTGRPDAAVWVLEDMSAVHKLEMSRRESENRLRAVIESIVEGIVVQNYNGLILEANSAACTILGVTYEQILKQRWLVPELECVREDGSPIAADEHPDRVALKLNAPVREFAMGLPAGDKRRWLLVSSLPLPALAAQNANLQQGRVVTTFADISELMSTRAQNQQLSEELEVSQRLDVVGKLASGTIHDCNNLVAGMIGLAAVAQLELDPQHPTQINLARMIELGRQASRLTGQVLAFSKRRRRDAILVDLNDAIRFTLKLLRGVLPPEIEVVLDIPVEPRYMKGEETQIQQTVMNLCLNARDAMPSGGVLRVASLRRQTPHGWQVGIVAQDTGIGMAPDVVQRVFEPFFTTKEHGTGLGLAVVQQIVAGFGGVTEVHSEPGQGARFELWFPESLPSIGPD